MRSPIAYPTFVLDERCAARIIQEHPSTMTAFIFKVCGRRPARFRNTPVDDGVQ
jgi:hypothetical protein